MSGHHESGASEVKDTYEVGDLVDELAFDYGKYFSVDNSKEIAQFEEAVEQNLTHLEEFCGVLEVMRSEEMDKVDGISSIVSAKVGQLDEVCREIDKLEAFVNMVKGQVEAMEEELSKAERLLFNSNRVKKFLASFLPNKKVLATNTPPKPAFTKVFRTEDFLSSHQWSEASSDFQSETSSRETDKESS